MQSKIWKKRGNKIVETQTMFGGEMKMNDVSRWRSSGDFLLPTSAMGSSTSDITAFSECRPEDTMPLPELQPASSSSPSSSSLKSGLEDLRVTSLDFLGFWSDCGFSDLPLFRAPLGLGFEAEEISASEEFNSSLLG